MKIFIKAGIITIFTFTILHVGKVLFAQEKKFSGTSLYYIGAKVDYGFLIPHHNELWGLTNGFYRSAEFSVWKQTNGKKGWQYHFHYPRIGITYKYTDFESKYLGVMNAVIPWMNFPLLSGKNFIFDFKFGLGVAKFNKKFDRLKNYRNLAIGSYWNAAVSFQLQARLRMDGQTFLNTGISMFHASNGTTRTPNFGVNEPALFVGLDIKLDDNEIKYIEPKEVIRRKGKIHFRIAASAGTKQIERDWDNEYRVFVGSVDFLRFYNNFNRYYLGFDAIYDESVRPILMKTENRELSDKEIMKYSIILGHEWVLSNLSLFAAIGQYVCTPDKSDGLIFNKIGLNYAVFKNLVFNLTLKSYYARADYLTVGVGLIL